jgi:hypothetical protein
MSDDVLDLLERAPAPSMSIDPYAVVLGGRRRLRRRRAGIAVAGIAAAAVVLAVVAQLPGGVSRQPVPASPSAPSTDVTRAAATLEAGRGRYHVRVEPRPDDPLHVTYLSIAPDGTETEIGGASLTGLGEELTYGHADASDVILGILPVDAKGVSAFFGADSDPNPETTWTPLPGTSYRAFAIGVRPPLTTDDLWFLTWTDAEGRHHTTDGGSTRSAVFTIPRTDDPVVLWADRERGAWGLTGGGLSASREGIKTPEVHLTAWPAAPGESGWVGAYGLLPAGARDIEVTAPPGRRLDGDVQWQALEDVDATAFLAVLDPTTAGSARDWAPRVTWVNANGTRGSFSLGG